MQRRRSVCAGASAWSKKWHDNSRVARAGRSTIWSSRQRQDMTTTIQVSHRRELDNARLIRLWLYVVAALVFAMVLVGGATRLTESGLSITEWQPVTGVLPPLSDSQWHAEFEKYQAIPQYRQLNAGMSLAAFKTIYWLEWAHRLIGRIR